MEYRIGFFQWAHDDPNIGHTADYCSHSVHCNFPAEFDIIQGHSQGVPYIGVVRNGRWLPDINGDNTWSGVDAAHIGSFGLATDKPVVFNGATYCNGNAKYARIGVLRHPRSWYVTSNNLY